MRKSISLFFILYNYISLEMEETSLLLLVWTMLLIILFILFLYTFSSSFKELWGALVTGTFGKQSQKPQVFILINNYRVTHKEWDFRNDFTDFFLAFRVPWRPKLSYFCAESFSKPIKKNTQLNAETKNSALNRKFL